MFLGNDAVRRWQGIAHQFEYILSGVICNKICGTKIIKIVLGDQVFYHGPVAGCDGSENREKMIKCLQVHYPVVYDTGANCHSVCNDGFLTDRRNLVNPVIVEGVGGEVSLNQGGVCPPFGEVLLNTKIGINIISGQKLERMYNLEYVQN